MTVHGNDHGKDETLGGYRIIGPLAYQGKEGCRSVTCTRMFHRNEDGTPGFSENCMGWHCSYCDAPCSSQGHRCDASEAILGEAKRLLTSTTEPVGDSPFSSSSASGRSASEGEADA